MTDKATIQPKSKPEKTTISISGETSERLEIYCRANGILRKEFVSLALDYFERTGFDLQSNALDYSPLEKIIGATPIISVSVVIKIGRKRTRFACKIASVRP